MDLDYLIGYRICLRWKGEEKGREYTFVEGDFGNGKLNINSPIARQLQEYIDEGFSVIKEGQDFVIEYIKPPKILEEVMYERQIEKLYHFTSIKNLKNILLNGIMSVENLKKEKLDYFLNDGERLDKKFDFISCSVGFPNGILLNYFKNKFKERYAIIEISADVLYENFAMISARNASTGCGKYIKPIEYIEELFEGERESLPDNFPTDEQAEILIKDKISPKYFTRIIFEHEYDKKYFATHLQKIVEPKMFDYRNNYLYNKTTFKIKKY